MSEIVSEFASQYKMTGQFADMSDIIRNSLVNRSIIMSAYNVNLLKISMEERAAKLYNDWEYDLPAEWPSTVKKRNGKPYAFNKRVGKWVPTHSNLEWVPDVNDWINNNATASKADREDYLNKWITLSRSIRTKLPYSHYPVELIKNNVPGSIIIRNIDSHISDADLLMAFSAFGPIIDLHHPLHWKNKKRSLFVFIEYYDVSSIDTLFSEIDDSLYFNDCHITIERAGSRKTSDDMKTKCAALNVSAK
jgi:hypothetical protein